MIKKTLGLVFVWIWIALSFYTILAIYFVFNNTIAQESEYFSYFVIGVGVYLISMIFIKPKKYQFLDTFFHELSHTIFAFLTGAKVNKFVVSIDSLSSQNGYVEYQFKSSKVMDIVRSHLVSLAPYYFSPITAFLLVVYYISLPSNDDLFTNIPMLNGLLFLIGFFYMYHLRASISQAKPYQTDFNGVGYLYGIGFVIFTQGLFMLFMVTILSYNFDGFYYLLKFII